MNLFTVPILTTGWGKFVLTLGHMKNDKTNGTSDRK